jgi:hypothetical protein
LKDYVLEHYHGYLDVFTEKEAIPLPPHQPWDHVVTLIPDVPPLISCRVYPLSRGEEEFQAKYIKEQEDAGLIRKSKSPYSTPIFYIKKKNGSYRPIFDYRKINAITVKDVFPLPRIDTIIEGMHDMVLFSKFDLCNSYWNICNSEEMEDLMAFKTTTGLYAPRVMSFGPTNAPACMQRLMNHIFQPLRDRYPRRFENYMDDCSVATRRGELDLHRQITREFFKILRENHLFLRPQKCLFEAEEMDFLGMRLNHHGITIDPSKIKGLTDWPRELKNVKEIRKVLGVLGYQRPFIPNFA